MFINLIAFLFLILIDTTTFICLLYHYYAQSFYILLLNDGVMFITMVLVIYEWYFVILQQDNYICKAITSWIWKLCVVVSCGVHTLGVVILFRFQGCNEQLDGSIVFYACYFYAIMFWFLCFCWEYYKMSRRSFAASVNRNLNLSSFILNACFITLFETCFNIIPHFSFDTINGTFSQNLIQVIGFLLTTIGLFTIIVKTYLFRQKKKKESIMMSNNRSIVIDGTVGLAVIVSIVGAIIFTLSYPSFDVHDCLYWLLSLHVYFPWSMLFGCFLIFFNIVSVTIP